MKDRKTIEWEKQMEEESKRNTLALADRMRKKGMKLLQEKRFEEADKHFKEADKLVNRARDDYDPKTGIQKKKQKKAASFFGALADSIDE